MTDDQMNEIKRHFNVVVEDLRHDIKLIAEGHATLDRKIDRVQAEATENHREAMAMIHTVHDSLKTDIDSVRDELKADIHAVGEKVDGHEERITHLEKKVA